MPQHNINRPAGEQTPDDIKEILLRFFSKAEIERLEKFGGRITISLTAPFTSRKNVKKNSIEIGEPFISHLRQHRDDPPELKTQLDKLSVKQLYELGKLLGQPLRTKSPRQELIGELVSHFHGEGVWKRISNGQ